MAVSSIYDITLQEQLPETSAAALRAFEERFLLAMLAVPPQLWVDDYGEFTSTDAMLTTYPISILSSRYRPATGEPGFRSMPMSLSIGVKEYETAHRIDWLQYVKGTFRFAPWLQTAEHAHIAEQHRRAIGIAELLEDGENQPCWDDGVFFREDHWANPVEKNLGTYSNISTTPSSPNSVADIMNEIQKMLEVKDIDGNTMQLSPDTILLPRELYLKVRALFGMPFVALPVSANNPGGGGGTMSNPLMFSAGGFNVVLASQLKNQKDWYILDSSIVKSLPPWIALRLNVPMELALSTFDVGSDYFKMYKHIAVIHRIWYGMSLAFPQSIRKVKGI